MPDEIIRELWAIKDSIALEYSYDLDSLVSYVRTKKTSENRKIVNLEALKKVSEQNNNVFEDSDNKIW